MVRLLPLVCIILLAAPFPASAQLGAGLGSSPEGATLEVVAVPPGGGDGRITERDARAFCSWCVWGFREVMAAEGISTPLAPNAEALMLDFWFYVWAYVEPDTKATISQADVLWPQHQETWRTADPVTRQVLLQQFGGFLQSIWGGVEPQTVQYLTGQLPPPQYAMVIDQALASHGAGQGSQSGRGDTFEDQVSGIPGLPSSPGVVYDETHVMNDGSGDIMFSDPY